MFSYKKKYEELKKSIENINAKNIYTDELNYDVRGLDIFSPIPRKTIMEIINEIRKENRELLLKIKKIENDWDRTIDYNEKNHYVVTDLKNDMVNSFFDVKYAKEHIKKLQAKNIPYKVNKKLLKELNNGRLDK